MESKKLFYTMGEVSEMFCVAPSLIRHWESYFSVIKPMRNKKGNRLFTPEDIDNFKIIYHLVKERRMTLDGAQKCMRHNISEHRRNAELMERLQSIRSVLLEVREGLKESNAVEYKISDCAVREKSERLVVDLFGEVIEQTTIAETEETVEADEAMDIPSDAVEVGQPIDLASRNQNRTPDAKSSELFAFYEQSLF